MRELAIWIALGAIAAIVLYALLVSRGPSLRYVLAMVFAGAGALIATLLISSPIASYVTSQMRFDSPDGAATIHMLTYLGVSAGALLVGWGFGWLVAGPLIEREQVR